MKCRWIVREGTNNSLWAATTCLLGFNYLSKVRNANQIKSVYDGRLCPICGKPIEIDMKLIESEEKI